MRLTELSPKSKTPNASYYEVHMAMKWCVDSLKRDFIYECAAVRIDSTAKLIQNRKKRLFAELSVSGSTCVDTKTERGLFSLYLFLSWKTNYRSQFVKHTVLLAKKITRSELDSGVQFDGLKRSDHVHRASAKVCVCSTAESELSLRSLRPNLLEKTGESGRMKAVANGVRCRIVWCGWLVEKKFSLIFWTFAFRSLLDRFKIVNQKNLPTSHPGRVYQVTCGHSLATTWCFASSCTNLKWSKFEMKIANSFESRQSNFFSVLQSQQVGKPSRLLPWSSPAYPIQIEQPHFESQLRIVAAAFEKFNCWANRSHSAFEILIS